MLRFFASSFINATNALAVEVDRSQRLMDHGQGGSRVRDIPDLSAMFASCMWLVFDATKDLPLSRNTWGDIAILIQRCGDQSVPNSADPWLMVGEAHAMLFALQEHIIGDLAPLVLVTIQPDRAAMYEQHEPLFGQHVHDKWGDEVNRRIKSAGECIALEQHTAAVYHLMCVLEYGLRDFAKRMNVQMKGMKGSIDYAQWYTIIKAIEDRIAAEKAKTHLRNTPARVMKLTFQSEVATSFSNFKDAWRNHVAHGRETYGEVEAMTIYNAVRIFMMRLADGPR